jgi:hypothetical protein
MDAPLPEPEEELLVAVLPRVAEETDVAEEEGSNFGGCCLPDSLATAHSTLHSSWLPSKPVAHKYLSCVYLCVSVHLSVGVVCERGCV